MPTDVDVTATRERLLGEIARYRSCAVALSGGVDSAVVAKAAHLALPGSSYAVTAVSPSLASGELKAAREVAALIGIEHRILETQEFENSNYRVNDSNRCYFCKSELYVKMEELARRLDVQVLMNGTNRDDLQDYRPGLQAAGEHRVVSPLADCGVGKAGVRELARHWNLPVWDKPAAPCLSSRIAYGEEVTLARLQMIDQAERWLRDRGCREVRVRYHRGDLARIEVPLDQIPRLADPEFRTLLLAHLTELGFKFVTLDLAGFRSGSLNALISIELAESPSGTHPSSGAS
jgi:uncharacterized protein